MTPVPNKVTNTKEKSKSISLQSSDRSRIVKSHQKKKKKEGHRLSFELVNGKMKSDPAGEGFLGADFRDFR